MQVSCTQVGPFRNLVMAAKFSSSVPPRGGGVGTYTDLHDFTGADDGAYPQCNLIFDASGNLYGTA